MGAVTFGIPEKLTLKLRDLTGARSFVETGTFRGDTALWGSGHFDSVFTIEHDRERYRSAAIRLMNVKNIHLFHGDSRFILPLVLSHVKTKAIFWLDAHWTLEGTPDIQCPLLRELELITRRPPGDIILIDDANYFMEPPPLPEIPNYWPKLTDILELLKPRAVSVIDDVIVATPDNPELTLAVRNGAPLVVL
jgi:hypothetical protein